MNRGTARDPKPSPSAGKRKLYIEISPLLEDQFTGIPQVAAHLVEAALADRSVDTGFFLGEQRAPAALVRLALVDRSGLRLRRCLPALCEPFLPELGAVALFPNYKSCSGRFAREGFVLHDLSTLCTPQFHAPDTVAEHVGRLRHDIRSSAAVFCVSQATLDEARLYFPHDASRFVLATNGTEVPDVQPVKYADKRALVVILGTLEPRKNAEAVLRVIAADPGLAKRARFVFPGRYGWGKHAREMVAELGLEALAGDAIVFPGFVSEDAKHALLAQADLVVYPSVYEGFGLPVLEAALHGTPVLTTRSTALPELALPAVCWFSPFVEGDLRRGLIEALDDATRHPVPRRLRDARRWVHTYRTIRDTLFAGEAA